MRAGRIGWWRPFRWSINGGGQAGLVRRSSTLRASAVPGRDLGAAIEDGALFYGKEPAENASRVRCELRAQTEALARRMHELYAARVTPPAKYAKKCESCSLL